jgi:EmrB/QacA subfamily drug resistance transporter
MRQQNKAWTIALTSLGSLMAALDTLVVATALSTIRVDLHASGAMLEWTINAYTLTFAVLLITAAALGDRYGRRNLYAAGLGLFALASAGCALAPGVGWLIAFRVLQGAGAALLMPLGLALLSTAFPPERRGAAMGIASAVTGVSVATGPLIGGAIVQGLDWEWIFWLNVPIGLLAIPFVLTKLTESRGPRARLDLPGLALATASALGIVWGLVRADTAGWGSAEVLGALIGGLVLLAGFVAWERRAPQPMLPPALFRSRAFSASNVVLLCLSAGLFTGVFFYAQLLQIGLGYGPLAAGLRLMPWTATLIAIAPWAGALTDRIGARPLMAGGLALQAAGTAWLALIADPGVSYSALLAPLILSGIGCSMAIPAAQACAMGAVKPAQVGKAAGVSSTMRMLGGALGIAVAVAVFSATGSYATPETFMAGFAPAAAAGAALALIGAIAALALPGRRAHAELAAGMMARA